MNDLMIAVALMRHREMMRDVAEKRLAAGVRRVRPRARRRARATGGPVRRLAAADGRIRATAAGTDGRIKATAAGK